MTSNDLMILYDLLCMYQGMCSDPAGPEAHWSMCVIRRLDSLNAGIVALLE